MGSWDRLAKKRLPGNKYGAIKQDRDGYTFASKSEAALYDVLKEEVRAGLWLELHCQVSVYLTAARIQYIADFKTVAPDGKETYHEQKGYETNSWRIKRRLWKFYGPADLVVYNYDHKKKEVIFKERLVPRCQLEFVIGTSNDL